MAHIFRPRYRYEVVRKKLFGRDFGAAGVSGESLLADNIESGTELTVPTLTQVHALTNGEVVESETLVGTPAISVIDILSADDVESASEVGAPSVGQVHNVLANDLQSVSEIGSPVLSQVNALTADDVESAAELSAPSLSQIVDLGSNVIYLYKGAVQPSRTGSPAGNVIYLYKGAVQPTRVRTVPDVTGLTLSAATTALQAVNLDAGTVTYVNNDLTAGLVISQDPAAASSAVYGDTVDLVISLGPAPSAGGGRVKKGKKKPRYFVEVDGVLIEATSQDEATQILLQARELAKDQSRKEANPGGNIPKIRVLTRTKRVARAGKIVDAVEEANRQIARIYRDAQKALDASRAVTTQRAQREIADQQRKEARERDEQDAITVILLS